MTAPDPKSFKIPPGFTFVTIPKALAQFHHLPEHVPVMEGEPQEGGVQYNIEKGVKAMRALLDKAPNVPGAYLYKLFTAKWPLWEKTTPLLEADRVAEAIPLLIRVLDVDPECPLTCFQLGYCFRRTSEYEKSESFYLRALKVAPDAGWVYSNLGRTYESMGNRAGAAEAYRQGLTLLPGDEFILERLVALGELHAVEGGKGKSGKKTYVSKKEYEKNAAAKLEKTKGFEALLTMGFSLLSENLNDLAVSCFDKALSERSDSPDPLLGLGLGHLYADRPKEAEVWLVRYLDLKPDSVLAHLNLFRVYLAMEEDDRAWDEIQIVVDLKPDWPEMLEQFFRYYEAAGKVAEGVERMRSLALAHPTTVAPWWVQAGYWFKAGDFEKGEDAVKEVLKRSPANESVLCLYTAELGKRGRPQEVVDLLKKTPDLHPLSLTVNLAMAYYQLGRVGEAILVLKTFRDRPGMQGWERDRAEEVLKKMKGDSGVK